MINQNSDSIKTVIGQSVDRVDGRLKVTGRATYAAEHKIANAAQAVLVRSRIARGRIRQIDGREAERAAGVLFVLTHKNMPPLQKPGDASAVGTIPGENRLPFSDDRIYYGGQHVALVVAETLEQAEYAAGLVKVEYVEQVPAIVMKLEKSTVRATQPADFFGGLEKLQIRRGMGSANLLNLPVNFEQTFSTPTYHHNPIEPHAVIVVWENANRNLIVYDTTQAVVGSQKIIAGVLGLKDEQVRLVSPFVGGGFGCKGLIWWHPVLAAVAARAVKRPVKLVLTRQQMFTSNGHRGETDQTISFGANRSGKLDTIKHDTTTHVSEVGDFLEPCGLTTKMLYAAPNLDVSHTTVRLNVGTPTPMRAPGESPGTFALESAMDELAFELKIDPIDFRLLNHADRHPHDDREWSSKHLKECYRLGAEKFGWNRRKQIPCAVRDGHWLVGMGMATATYPGYRSPATARAILKSDGSAVVQSATQDIGTGTYTVMAIIAADTLGLPVERIRAELGDSKLPTAPTSGGSTSVASVGPAIKAACEDVRDQIIQIAVLDARSPLYGKQSDEIAAGDGSLFLKNDRSRSDAYTDILRRANRQSVEGCVRAETVTSGQQTQKEADNPAVKSSAEGGNGASLPLCHPNRAASEQDSNEKKYAFQSFGAQFVEVGVDEDLGIVRVRRTVSALDIGRIINAKTAESQVRSGVIMGIGMALMEETIYDERTARPVVRTLADYHVPSHADAPPIEAFFINQPDPHINSLGARGVGEIGITGVAAAIANAVFNATGKRIRDLPITPDKLL